MKHYLPLVLYFHCFLFINTLFAQNIQKFEQDSNKAARLFEDAWRIKFVNPDSTIALSRNGMVLSKYSKPMQMLGHRNISVAYSIKGNLDSAEYYCLKTLELAQKLNIPTAIASAYQNLGIVASQKGNNKRALNYYNKITEIAVQTGDSLLVMRNLINLGLSYYKLGDYRSSTTQLMRGLKIAETYKDTISITQRILVMLIMKSTT
jgi:tetratricopeptide (TPR) repeat protein